MINCDQNKKGDGKNQQISQLGLPLALFEAKKGNSSQFVNLMSTAKQIDPKIIQELMHMTDDLSVLNIDLEESAYRSVLLIEPHNTDALLGLGDLLINIDEALDIYQNILESDNQAKFKLEKNLDSLQ